MTSFLFLPLFFFLILASAYDITLQINLSKRRVKAITGKQKPNAAILISDILEIEKFDFFWRPRTFYNDKRVN